MDIELNYTQLTMEFDSSHNYACTGAWTDHEFKCSIKWSPTGRECSGDLTVHAGDDGSLTVWPFTGSGTVICQKQ